MAVINNLLGIGLVRIAAAKQGLQAGLGGHGPVGAWRCMRSGARLEPVAEIGVFAVPDFLGPLLPTFGTQTWIIELAQPAGVQPGPAGRAQGLAAEWQRQCGQRGAAFPAHQSGHGQGQARPTLLSEGE